ncbi:MAG: tRNA pseudouridine(55) synthase TruB [Clostridia bacterium]
MDGFLNLLKPPGMTSSDAVVYVRRMLRDSKVGHAGTLDPEAAGVLPIMIGKAARLFDYLVDKEKRYIAEWMPGIETDTQDAQGKVVSTCAMRPTLKALTSILPQFIGEVLQVPPAYSAIKCQGQKAYDLARAGETVALAPRLTQIHAITVEGQTARGGVMLQIICGKGTYVRTICHDIGRALGCGAHMAFLLRTRSGMFDIAKACTLEEMVEAQAVGRLETLLIPMDEPLSHLPCVHIPETAFARARNGNPIPTAELSDIPAQGQPVRLYMQERFAGIGICQEDAIRFQSMLL